jgi:hypothetical protein
MFERKIEKRLGAKSTFTSVYYRSMALGEVTATTVARIRRGRILEDPLLQNC